MSLAPKMIKSRPLENTDIMNEVYFAKMKFAAWNINLSFEGSSNLKLNQKKHSLLLNDYFSLHKK